MFARTLVFASRTQKELVRDPLTYVFGVGLPLMLLVLMTILNKSIPGAPFALEGFAPGMAVFGLTFISLFSGMLVARDRSSSFLMRAFASPMTAGEYIAGYSAPLVLMSVFQGLACFLTSAALGLPLSVHTLAALAAMLPTALMYVGLGILLGTVMSDKQVGGIASLIVNVATLLSGTWFSLELVSEGFRKVCYYMPFAHAVDAVRGALLGASFAGADGIGVHILWVLGYTALIMALASLLFRNRMRSGKA